MTTSKEDLSLKSNCVRRNKKIAFIAFVMAIVLLLSACSQAPFRLHIIANSDTDDDQQIKLMVRDAVLDLTSEDMLACTNSQDAQEYIENNLEIIEKTANETLTENGLDYSAHAEVGTFHFPEKTYQDVTYPEGDYQALRVTLGEGKGHNWWCVMFPPLCITEMDTLEEQDVEYTSFFAELISSMFE